MPIILLIYSSSLILSGGDIISLKISDIEKWVSRTSPELRISLSEKKLGEVSEYLDSGLSVTNPEFSFKNEWLKSGSREESEREFEVSKSFDMPWLYAAKKNVWKSRKEAIGLNAEAYRLDFFSRMRAGYVELVLMKRLIEEYGKAGKVLLDLYHSETKKEKEGFLSRLDLRLIRLAAVNMSIRTHRRSFELGEKENTWKQAAGIDPVKVLVLSTDIVFKPAEGLTGEKLTALYRLSPDYRQWEAREKSLREKINTEKMGVFPDITLSAGYKRVSDGPGGPVLGVSFSLPLLNLNSVTVKKRRIELELMRNRSEWSVKSGYRELDAALRKISGYSELLRTIPDPPVSPTREILPLREAFLEGAVSVTDLISGIELMLEGMEQYHSALAAYYSNIFKLEGMTGARIITFDERR